MDNIMISQREMDVPLGLVARSIRQEQDMFAVLADPLSFSVKAMRFPSGMIHIGPDVPLVDGSDEVMELERWDGLS